MFLHEAILKTTKEKPFLARKKWSKTVLDSGSHPICIQPTDSPDGCLLYGPSQKRPHRRWWPMADDLMASDWETVSGELQF